MKVVAIVVISVAVATLQAISPVSAQSESCGGESDSWGRWIGCEDESSPIPGGSTGTGAKDSRLPVGWTVELLFEFSFGGLPVPGDPANPNGPYPCDPATGAAIPPDQAGPDAAAWPGRLGQFTIRNAAGFIVVFSVTCYASPEDVLAWLPPTRGEIESALESAPWPESRTGVDPTVEGLTGLETWLWSQTVDAQPISVTVGNATVIGTAAPSQYRWAMGDGATATSSTPGSQQSPATRYVYETKGVYTIVLEIAWQADVEIITMLPDGTELRFRQDPPLAPVTVAGSLDYRVVEVRSILVPNAP